MPDFSLLTDFHFLRPLWFLGLIPAAICLLIVRKSTQSAGNWEKLIHPQLIPYLLQTDDNNSSGRTPGKFSALLLAWSLFCVGLAGPTWEKLPQPVHREDSALVLILDLSPSMLAEDMTPSRLVRARYKLMDILALRQQGFTGLVVYGGEAHAVSPLTEDTDTIINLIPTLHPSLLPEYGSNTEDALATAIAIAEDGGHSEADLVLITDGVSRSAFADIRAQLADSPSMRLSILGIGTAQGAPIPMGNGGFVKDRSGAIVIPKLDTAALQSLAALGGGSYQTVSADDSDINRLIASIEGQLPSATTELERSFDLWQDQGHWLILLIIPLLLLSFRRGLVFTVALPLALLDPSTAQASVWQDLWLTADQQGYQAMQQEDPESAASLFEDRQWQASAAYQSGDYGAAADRYREGNSADAKYNLGNALARLGDLDGAIEAYNQALNLETTMEDALANRELIEQLLKEQQQSQQQQNQDQNQDQSQSQSQNQQSDQSQQGQPQSEQNQQSQQQSQQAENKDWNEEQSKDQSRDQSEPASPEQSESQQSESEQKESEQKESEQKESSQQQDQSVAENPQDHQNNPDDQQSEQNPLQQAESQQTEEQDELAKQQQQELEQWLRRVPDDPGGLLRRKFHYQAQQRAREQQRPKPPNQQERW
jgi:Ca-activated chloride channel family protein